MNKKQVLELLILFDGDDDHLFRAVLVRGTRRLHVLTRANGNSLSNETAGSV
jgi:hypothetical protein